MAVIYIFIYFIMNDNQRNNKNFRNPEFSESINKYSMKFLNPNYEKKFYKTKFEKKNIFVAIGISIYFTMIIMGLRFLQGTLFNKLDIGAVIKRDANLISSYLWNLPLIVEGIIYFIPKLNIFRGFFFNTSPMIALIYFSNTLCLNFQTTAPLYIPISIMYAMMAIVICFIYAANWICGAIQIIIILGSLDVHIIMFDWSWITNKSILIPISISTAITVILAIYSSEYFQRKAVFMRLQAEEQIQNLKQIIDNLPDPIIVGKEGNIVYKNSAFLNIMPSNNNQVVPRINVIEEEKQPNQINIPEEENNTHRQIQIEEESKYLGSIIQKSNSASLEEIINNNMQLNSECFEIKALDEIKAVFEITSAILNKGGEEMTLYLLKNLTNYHLINKLKDRETFLRVYFASLTHDFRTPLGIIMGNVEILRYMIRDDEILKYLRIIYNSGSILSLLVQDVLDYSQLKSGSLRMAAVNFNIYKEFGLIIELFEAKFKDKSLYLKLQIGDTVPLFAFNDCNRIKQVLLNLISNAFKFTKNGGVKLAVTSQNNNELIAVTVEDTGIGIKEEDLSKLFKEFGRIEGNEEVNPNGIGLGLHICKNLVENLGGIISVTSQINEGSKFRFTFTNKPSTQIVNPLFPIIRSKSRSVFRDVKRFSPKMTSSVKKPKDQFTFLDHLHLRLQPEENSCDCHHVLIVDDDLGMRNVMKNFCKILHVKFDEAENGQVALESVCQKLESPCCKYYKIILTDFHMPIMDGIQSSILIKKELKHFPDNMTNIILISGLSEEELNLVNDLDDNPFASIESKPLSFAKFKDITELYIL